MISVKCLASGSAGNSYAVDDGKSVLLLEAGIRKRTILAGYMDLLMRVQGCLITHEHQDHTKAALGLPMAGIDVYASGGTFAALNAEKDRRNYRLHSIKAGEQFTLGTWTVLPWEAQHDAAEPLGFLLYSKETRDKLIFATDTYFIPNTFRGLTYIMVECNYDRTLLDRNISAGSVPESLRPRLVRSHFSLDNVRTFLTANDLSTVQRIYLLHVSNRNGDKDAFRRDIEALTGIPVTVF
ncbi:MBL fold metallo-hydrolase [Neglectibacter sp. CSJ-5]|uniref:MBL fold metallo-hydrolase n=1 Tax=Neglectibacter sp. CSJ-5 TaxID=3078043 RepID=UPI00292DC32F|nr:MBL fold metallo-hydrolase [Neglectibacter sp. CSJ-5]